MAETGYEFSVDWFEHYVPIWSAVFRQFLPKVTKILEIGSYEGRATIWMMHNGIAPNTNAELYCIDTWQGGLENTPSEMPEVERRYDRNVAKAKAALPWITVRKIRSTSTPALATLLTSGHRSTFDFVYVDGSHQAPDVLSDLVFAFELCRAGGVIACDDYLWDLGKSPLLCPKIAIDGFVNAFAAKVRILPGVPLYQLFLQKMLE